ncbi:MAG: site-specific integrase [Chitinophagales bacterium]|nr:site-specific integrase [Chitinophagales bacterium]
MIKVKAVLFTSKTLSNGEHPIMIRLYRDRKLKYLATGYSAFPHQWDDEKSLPTKRHPLADDIEVILKAKLNEASKLNVFDQIEDKESNLEETAVKLKRGKASKVTLLDFFGTYSKELYEDTRIGYSKLFNSVGNSIRRFTEGKDFRFTEVDVNFLNRYNNYLIQEDLKITARSAYFRTFRTLFKEAINRKICPSNHYPFKAFDFSDYNDPETDSRSIDKSQVQRILNLEIIPGTRKHLSQNMFKFSYYASGMNFIDMATLKWKEIKKDKFTYTREKTDKPIIVVITPKIAEVLQYYRQINYGGENSYVFPILNRNFADTPEDQNTRYNRLVGKRGDFNKDMKTLAKWAGVDENVTSYVARHSFAHNLYTNGIQKRSIGQALGHRYEKTTNKYIGKLDYKRLANEFEDALSK